MGKNKTAVLEETPLNNNIKSCPDISVSVEDYLKFHFPKKDGETKIKISHLWGINYRINMWKNADIPRSFFVQVKKVKGKWTHKIIPD